GGRAGARSSDHEISVIGFELFPNRRRQARYRHDDDIRGKDERVSDRHKLPCSATDPTRCPAAVSRLQCPRPRVPYGPAQIATARLHSRRTANSALLPTRAQDGSITTAASSPAPDNREFSARAADPSPMKAGRLPPARC